MFLQPITTTPGGGGDGAQSRRELTDPRRALQRWQRKRGKRGGLHARLKACPSRPLLLSLLLANVRSLENKLDELRARTTTQQLIFTKTWLSDKVPEFAVQLQTHSVHRGDQTVASNKTKAGGSVALRRVNRNIVVSGAEEKQKRKAPFRRLLTRGDARCVLSPILYTLFTHDCVTFQGHYPKPSKDIILKFADDTAVIGCITDGDEAAYRSQVKVDLIKILNNFYSCIVESILISCITVWYGSTTAMDCKRIYHCRVHRRAASILKDPNPSTDCSHFYPQAGGT
ncbi:hypothetical protein N1851_010226 [Merluccius polli]|uniref:Reverse transcriptase domain-containing protein n=1 Tax=Merluccius polli TaxID=89951 RepID=A0AA47N030_MERPO|nr:hypothetical protein N1851_010226 [Merluccius polli]